MAGQMPSSSSGSSTRRRRPSLNTVGGPCGWTALSIGDCLLRVLGEMAQEGVLGVEELEQIQQMFLLVCTNYLPRLIPRGVRYKMKGKIRCFSCLSGRWRVCLQDAVVLPAFGSSRPPMDIPSLTLLGASAHRGR
eukprot:GHVS01076519.1.p1 GENE.GHVS01076519.1~~GHVS01076519.1.p1  ORF type:complete len:135 (-),score=28.09 GHVS01076519.1:234-638(-)